ncbi:MAG TPA: VWA domain-containing protein [Polyangiaceae bacterium]|nr:VWA domain-containing protein [Polyangiaceae bacterium]
MSLALWLRKPQVGRGLAVGSVVLAMGGLVLARAGGGPAVGVATAEAAAAGPNAVTFAAPGARGVLALSQTQVLGGERAVYGELKLKADEAGAQAKQRAPLSLAVVLDTSGSMSGDKIRQAKEAAVRLVQDMHEDDQVAFVRYASDAETLQGLARVGDVRRSLVDKIRAIEAGGGTAIPLGLSRGLRELAEASPGRVRRVVLVSDGLDSTRAEAERLARESFERGTTISSLGVGLDFDEAYMNSVSRAGHGNFAFVKDASALASFLSRELKEASSTTVEDAVVRLRLPEGLSLVRAVGADARAQSGGWVEVRLGSLFAGDERRAVLELRASLGPGATAALEGEAAWRRVGGERAEARVPRLAVAGTSDERAAERSVDAAVLASATSVLAAERQLVATEAYARGDRKQADSLMQMNIDDLRKVERMAPPVAKRSLGRQLADYEKTRGEFDSAAPGSEVARERAKSSYERNSAHTSRAKF